MKGSTYILAFLAAIISTVRATCIEKEQLCSTICWADQINDHEGCKKRCVSSERPTDEESRLCQTCIDGCALYLSDHQNMALYTECRKGCFSKYFPMFTNSRIKTLSQREQRELIPGISPRIRGALGGHTYPVEKSICELSCRAQGADNIMEQEGTMKTCVESCKRAPTPREQELQISLDCRTKCPTAGEDSEKCLLDCVSASARSRAPDVSFTVNPLPPMSAASAISENAGLETALPVGNISKSSTKGDSLKKPTTTSTGDSDETIYSSSSAQSRASDQVKSSSKPDQLNSATGFPYFESFWFWIHATGTIAVALIIGLQVI